MVLQLENAKKYENGRIVPAEGVEIPSGVSASVSSVLKGVPSSHSLLIMPGLADVHVHFREPGFSYKETLFTGSRAAAHGGFTSVCTMPNLNPVPDNLNHLEEQTALIKRDACIEILPFGSITKGEKGQVLSDMDALAPFVAGFSDDGHGVESEERMEDAMRQAKRLGKVISAHCEVKSLSRDGVIHDGPRAAQFGLPGINSESEWREVERDIRLAARTGCSFHVCHVSTKESVALIQEAQKAGLDVSAETCPHYLLLCDEDLKDRGNFKMNPPLRSKADREALREAICQGVIRCVVTDHAPHSKAEKDGGLLHSLMGVVGLETSFPSLYTGLVKTGLISLEDLLDRMCLYPRARFGLETPDTGSSFTLFDLSEHAPVNPDTFLSKGRSTPFEGMDFYGKCLMTVYRGKIAYIRTSEATK
ncbi:MAG: dihydroorotase [Clostridia bacterium]|nr:dihydroorotase [Clostridia bacterium]